MNKKAPMEGPWFQKKHVWRKGAAPRNILQEELFQLYEKEVPFFRLAVATS